VVKQLVLKKKNQINDLELCEIILQKVKNKWSLSNKTGKNFTNRSVSQEMSRQFLHREENSDLHKEGINESEIKCFIFHIDLIDKCLFKIVTCYISKMDDSSRITNRKEKLRIVCLKVNTLLLKCIVLFESGLCYKYLLQILR
jgi:hypothetical protein